MWNDTEVYNQIMRCAEEWSKIKERIYIKAIWIRGDGQYQVKEFHVSNGYIVEWFEDNLDAYWVADEAEMKIVIEGNSFYWKHPVITAPITVEEIERQEEIAKSRTKHSGKRIMSLADIGSIYREDFENE